MGLKLIESSLEGLLFKLPLILSDGIQQTLLRLCCVHSLLQDFLQSMLFKYFDLLESFL